MIIIRVCITNTALKYPGCCPNIFDRSSLTTVYKVTFNNISAISWRSVLVVNETGVNHRPIARH